MDCQIMLADDVGINANEPKLTQCFLKRNKSLPASSRIETTLEGH